MRHAVLVAIGLVAIGGGCTGTGSESDTRAVTLAPTAAEAKQAIRRDARFSPAADRPRSIEGCVSDARSTTCAVDYDGTCAVLAVTRTAGTLVVAPSRERFACLHTSGWTVTRGGVP